MDPRRRLALAVLCLAWFMAAADSTIVSIALPATRRKLGFSGADAQWVLNGYALAFGGLLLVCGRAGDLYGRRLLFLAGLGVFGAVSLLGGSRSRPVSSCSPAFSRAPLRLASCRPPSRC